MSELKLRRLTEHNQRLRDDLARPRIRVSEASARCVASGAFQTLPVRVTNENFVFLLCSGLSLLCGGVRA